MGLWKQLFITLLLTAVWASIVEGGKKMPLLKAESVDSFLWTFINYLMWILACVFIIEHVGGLLTRWKTKTPTEKEKVVSQLQGIESATESIEGFASKFVSKTRTEIADLKASRIEIKRLVSATRKIHAAANTLISLIDEEQKPLQKEPTDILNESNDSDISSASDRSDMSGYIPDPRERPPFLKGSKEALRNRRKAATRRKKQATVVGTSTDSPASSEGEEESSKEVPPGDAKETSPEEAKKPFVPESEDIVEHDFPVSPSRARKPRSLSGKGRSRRPRRKSGLSISRSKHDEEGGSDQEGSDEASSTTGIESDDKKAERFALRDLDAALAGLKGAGDKEEEEDKDDTAGGDLSDLKAALSGLGSWEKKESDTGKGKKKHEKYDLKELQASLAGLEGFGEKSSGSSSSSSSSEEEKDEEDTEEKEKKKTKGKGISDDLKAALAGLEGFDDGKWDRKEEESTSEEDKEKTASEEESEKSSEEEEGEKAKTESGEEAEDNEDKSGGEESEEGKDDDTLKKALEGLGSDWLDVLSPSKNDEEPEPRRSVMDIFSKEGGAKEDSCSGEEDGEKEVGKKRAENEVISEYAAKEDTNIKGLRRAKKAPLSFGKGSNKRSSMKLTPEMEDAHAVEYPIKFDEHNEGALFVVLDGHVGKEAALAAQNLLPTEFKAQWEKYVASHPESEKGEVDIKEVFSETFKNVDGQMKEYEFVGCTCTAVFVWMRGGERYLQAANVGDSTAFLFRGGKAVQLTYDHKVKDESEKARMIADGVEITPSATRINGLAVSRALGDHFVKENNMGMSAVPYISDCYTLTEEDTIMVVASDGLWDVQSGQEALESITKDSSAEKMAARLLKRAVSDSKCNDNVTVIVARL